ncbi:hypothetical protein FQN54_004734 [Arachnomyces sp. PD_36]|nr:hypothetical protein FQN54_004734 [Arachnomyces sp. PD_36]
MGNIELQDYLAIKQLAFEWADSMDNKDWDRLRSICAPTLMVDYSALGFPVFPRMEPEEFIHMIGSPNLLGDPLVRTQHLLGAVKFQSLPDNEILSVHQIRAAHQRYADTDLADVTYRGHGYGSVNLWYKKIDEVWKLSGVRPQIYWSELDFDKIFPNLPGGS